MRTCEEEIQFINEKIDFIADCLELELPKRNYHDCRAGHFSMHADKQGNLSIEYSSMLGGTSSRQPVDFCPVCGWEAPIKPCAANCTIPRRMDDGP